MPVIRTSKQVKTLKTTLDQNMLKKTVTIVKSVSEMSMTWESTSKHVIR